MSLLPRWLTPLEPALLKLWEVVVSLFERHPVRIAIAAALLVAAVATGNRYVERTRQYQDIVSTTVRAETEDTPQRFKVLEAFVMSTIAEDASVRIRRASMSSAFTDRLKMLDAVLRAPAAAPGLPEDGRQILLSIPDYVSKVDALPVQNAILTDDASDGFLFFPLKLLRTTWEQDYVRIFNESLAPKGAGAVPTAERQVRPSPTLTTAVNQDRAIVDDIAVSRRLLDAMKGFTHDPLFKTDPGLEAIAADVRPVQIYYITKNGVNRIVNNETAADQKIVYRNMFRSTTFFPSRPYFIEAFRQLPKEGTLENVSGAVGDAFYVSQPYLDIGGFGVVITLARPVRYAGHSDAALCLDLRVRLDNPVMFQLQQRLQSFGSAPRQVSCSIGFGGDIECTPRDGARVEFPLKTKLEERLNSTMNTGDLSTVVGNISILDTPPRAADVATAGAFDLVSYPAELVTGYNTRPLTFAIPLTAPKAAANHNGLEAQFMVASLNLDRFQQVTSLYGVASMSCLAAAFFVVLLSWQGEMRTRRSYQEAFEIVDDVLYGAPTPYCRLDGHDAIVDCNTAFCALVGFPADQESIRSLRGRTFESLLSQRSKATYHDVQARRRKGEEVQPYTLYFTRRDQTEIETRITSGVIPGSNPRELPQTFGVVITSAEMLV